ncbi:MAG TPA: hypothetical protein VF626_04350 [Chthoniobacterales bacterium]
MKTIAKGASRLGRCFILVACAGGVLAADNSWVGTFDFGFVSPNHWFSSEASTNPTEASIAVDFPSELDPRAQMSMGGLINGLLFARPTSRWTLDSRALEPRSSLGRRIVEFDQINPVSAGDSFSSYEMPASFAPIVAATTNAPASPSALAASGTWIANASGNWSTPGNWAGGVVADGAGSAASFTFNITTDVTVTLDTSRTIGSVFIGDLDGTQRYTIAPSGGSSLTFDSGDPNLSSSLQQTITSAGDTVAVNILLNNNLDILNLSPTNAFTITGNIAASAPSTFLFVSFGGTVNVSGNISNGTTGTQLSVQVNDGVTTFTGMNTYGGSTSVEGTLLVNGNNSGATGTVFVSGSGAVLGGTGTVGGNVQTFDGTITGATTGTVGTLTLLGNVDLSTGEGTGTYLANLSGNMSDLLAITGSLSLGPGSILDIDGTGDGITTYTIATFADRMGTQFGTVSGIPMDYQLVYHDMDIQLVPIPEPATWMAGALLVGALGFTQRRRLRGASARL